MSAETAANWRAALPPLELSTVDDPEVLKEAASDDFAGHIVPASWRTSRPSLTMAWLAVFSAMFWLVFPGTLTLLVGTRDTIIGMVLAAAVIAVASGILATFAGRTGITLALFSRRLLGYWGGAFASLVVGVTAIYYCAFEASVISLALHDYFHGTPIQLWYFITAACGVGLAIGGVRVWLDKFNGWLLPLYCVGLLIAVIWAIAKFGYHSSWLSYEPATKISTPGPGWVLAFSGYLSQLVLVMYLWDFARMSKKDDIKFHARVTFGAPFWLMTFVVNGIVGIFLAQTIKLPGPLSDTSAVLGLIALMGVAGVLLVWITQSRINTANFYVSSLNLKSFGGRILRISMPRAGWVLVVGVIVFVLMLTDVLSFLLDALNYQSMFVTGWVSIACVHVLKGRHLPTDGQHAEFRPGRLRAVNYAGAAAWLVSSVVGLLLLIAGGSFGATWAVPIVLVLSGGLYALLDRSQPSAQVILERPHDPRAEVDDPWHQRIRCGQCKKAYLAVEMDRNPADNHTPICAMCAERTVAFYRAAKAEAHAAAAGAPAGVDL